MAEKDRAAYPAGAFAQPADAFLEAHRMAR
jgi:hypothetical protein